MEEEEDDTGAPGMPISPFINFKWAISTVINGQTQTAATMRSSSMVNPSPISQQRVSSPMRNILTPTQWDSNG